MTDVKSTHFLYLLFIFFNRLSLTLLKQLLLYIVKFTLNRILAQGKRVHSRDKYVYVALCKQIVRHTPQYTHLHINLLFYKRKCEIRKFLLYYFPN